MPAIVLRAGLGFSILAVSVFLAMVAAAHPLRAAPAERVVIPSAITNAWARDIVMDLHSPGLRNAHVLAFKSVEDDRPWRVDHALVVFEMSRGRWELWHVARHPGSSGKHSPWSEVHVTDSTQRGSQRYDHRPTAAELKAFIELSRWSFSAETPFRLIRGTVDDGACRSVLGFESGYRFPDPSQTVQPQRP